MTRHHHGYLDHPWLLPREMTAAVLAASDRVACRDMYVRTARLGHAFLAGRGVSGALAPLHQP